MAKYNILQKKSLAFSVKITLLLIFNSQFLIEMNS